MPGTETPVDQLPLFLGGMALVILLIIVFAVRRRLRTHRHLSRREINRLDGERNRAALEVAALGICVVAIVLGITINIFAGIAFAAISVLVVLAFVFFFSTRGKNSDWFTGHTTRHSGGGRGV